MRNVPLINGWYWLTLIAASIFGTNTGDMISVYFHMGNFAGLPFIALALAAVFFVERATAWSGALFFWAAIIVIRTGATNIADATHGHGILSLAVIPFFIAGFVWLVLIYKRRAEGMTAQSGAPKVDGLYWLCMAMAGIVGTMLGDVAAGGMGVVNFNLAHLFGLSTGDYDSFWKNTGRLAASVILGAATVWALWGRPSAVLARPLTYWALLALIRTAGTAIGDFSAHSRLGLAGSSLLTGSVFIGLVIWNYLIRKDNLASSPAS